MTSDEPGHVPDVTIRKYEPKDRDAVRQIALDTFDAGEPVSKILTFDPPVADFITRYYTDFEPESAWVAESAGQVVGYVMGSVNEKRYNSVMNWKIQPSMMWTVISQALLFRREAWMLVRTALGGLRALFMPHDNKLNDYPAHFHINVKSGFRGAHVGRRLIEVFEQHVRDSKLPGVHARVRGDNGSGRKFFETVGFNVLFESAPIVLYYRDGSRKKFKLVTYGKKV